MKTLLEIRANRAAKIAEAKDLSDLAATEERDLTADEAAAVDTLLADIDQLDADAVVAEAAEQRSAKLQTAIGSLDDLPNAGVTNSIEPGTSPIIPDRSMRISQPSPRLRNFKGEQAHLRAHCAGQWIKGALLGDPEATQWCRDQSNMELRVMTGASNQAGGALVPEDFAATIINLKESFGVFAREAFRVNMTRDTMTVPRRTGGVTGYWVNETDSITASDVTLDQVNLTARKLASITRVSNDLLEDSSIAIGDFLAGEIAHAFASEEDDAGFNGTGASTYGGINGVTGVFDANEAFAGVHTAASGIDTFAELTVADLTSTMGVLPEYAHDGAKWYVSQAGFGAAMARLAHTAGGETSATIQGRLAREFMGYEVVISQKLQTSLSDLSQKTMVLFGNLAQAVTYGQRRDITISADSSRYFENDQTAFRGTERIDIVFHERGDASTAGSIVGCMGD